MSDKPYAVRLADALDDGDNFYAESSMWFDKKLASVASEAADELRRLYAENEALRLAEDARAIDAESRNHSNKKHRTVTYVCPVCAASLERQE